MLVEITGTSISNTEVVLDAVNLEVGLTEDLFTEFDDSNTVHFTFKVGDSEPSFKYLYTIVANNRKCKAGKSIGARIQLLQGQILNLSENFIAK